MSKIPVFCFSHAGGMSFAYRDFVTANGRCEFIPIDTSGHGKRMGEKRYLLFDEIVEDLFNKVRGRLEEGQQFIFMGHSMGAWIAFEVAKRMQREKSRTPLFLILSSNVPARYYTDRVSIEAEDSLIRAQLLERNPDLKQFFEDEMLCDTFYPIIKADYIAIDNYLNKPEDKTKVSCRVLGLLADGDRFDEEAMSKWSNYTEGDYRQIIIKGDHFAFYKEHEYVKKLIENEVSHFFGEEELCSHGELYEI